MYILYALLLLPNMSRKISRLISLLLQEIYVFHDLNYKNLSFEIFLKGIFSKDCESKGKGGHSSFPLTTEQKCEIVMLFPM